MKELFEIKKVADLLARGEVVAIPTESSFGLSARVDSPNGLKRLFSYKPERKKPIPLIISDPSMLTPYAEEIPERAKALIERFWPGPLTLVFTATDRIPEEIHQGTKSVGIRQPGLEILCELCALAGVPLTATSANLPGQTPITTIEDLHRVFPDLIVWSYLVKTPGGSPSTIVDPRCDPPRILREGRIPANEILSFLKQPSL
jgi:L-threonylcarbamoyladenylate synthase